MKNGREITKSHIKHNKGITLIALVITIIVLLILAGVSIAMLTGTNGTLTQAQNAKQTTEIAQVKEEWDLEKLGLQMQEQKTDAINASGEEVKNYIKNMPNNLVGKISIIKGNLAYDINKFTKEEQLTMKSDYGFKATGDTIAPYGSTEKKLKDGKVEITVFSADDESDVDEIILPDGTSKKIQYETENILLKGDGVELEKSSLEELKQYFKNITLDSGNKISDVEKVSQYNTIIDLNSCYGVKNTSFINECFKVGKNLLTSGNDTTETLEIIKEGLRVGQVGGIEVKINKIQNNEVMKYYNMIGDKDTLTLIKFIEGTNVWATTSFEGNQSDAIGEYVSENGNRWIHRQMNNYGNDSTMFNRNAIYRITGSRSATYITNKNGVYTFKIKDLAGNETEISTEVNEL